MTTPRTKAVKQLLRTRGALVAAATAGGVGVWLLATDLFQYLITLIGVASSPGLYGVAQDPVSYWSGFANYLFVYALPIAVGFFVSLWLVAPISEQLGLGHVITRSVLAVGIASTLYFIVRVLVDIIGSLVPDRSLFSNSFPQLQFDGPGILTILSSGLQGGLLTLVSLLPLGVLAGILLWHWRKANPAQFHVEGLIDV